MYLRDDLIEKVKANHDVDSVVREFNTAYREVVYPPKQYFRNLLLCGAVNFGHLSLVEGLLKAGFPVNEKSGYPSPCPIHIACLRGDQKCIALLLEHGSDINVEAGASLDFKGPIGNAVEFILKNDDVELLAFVSPGYDTNRNRHKRTLLHLSAEYGARSSMEYLLALNRYDVNATDSQGNSALMLAIKHGPIFIETLLQHGASMGPVPWNQTAKGTQSKTLLHVAVHKYTYTLPFFVPDYLPSTVRTLLVEGEKVNAKYEGLTALHMLCSQISTEVQCEDIYFPFSLETHCAIVVETAQILLQANPFAKDVLSVCREVFNELDKACELFRNCTYSGQVENRFNALLSATKLGRDLLKLMFNYIDHYSCSQEILMESHIHVDRVLRLLLLNHDHSTRDPTRIDWSNFVLLVANILELILPRCGTNFNHNLLARITSLDFALHRPIFELLLRIADHEKYWDSLSILKQFSDPSDDVLLRVYVYEKLSSPRKLQESSWVHIFNQLHPPKIDTINCLPLPDMFKNYVLYNEH